MLKSGAYCVESVLENYVDTVDTIVLEIYDGVSALTESQILAQIIFHHSVNTHPMLKPV